MRLVNFLNQESVGFWLEANLNIVDTKASSLSPRLSHPLTAPIGAIVYYKERLPAYEERSLTHRRLSVWGLNLKDTKVLK